MKLFRYGPPGNEKPGILDAEGNRRDLSSVIDDINPRSVGAGLTDRLAGVDLGNLPVVSADERLGPCVGTTGNFIAIGLNYLEHARETNSPIPETPIVFTKAPSCIVGPNDAVLKRPEFKKLDWEVELALVIGKRAFDVPEDEALSHVMGYCVCNDVSERELQLERGSQWAKGKSFPSFGPIGPYLVTSDEIDDPQNLELWMEVNGERVQHSNTSDMIFSIREIVSYLSRHMILLPGDLITTGTPPGVGLGMKPVRFLKDGDVMKLGIDKLGVQQQTVVTLDG